MPVFDYLGVLISIVLGLGITRMLTWMGRIIKDRSGIRLYTPYLLWFALLFFTIVQVWWGLWNWRRIEQFYFFSFLYLAIVPMVLLYVLAELMVPDVRSDESVDLEAYYFAQQRNFFSLFVVFYLLVITGAVLIRGAPLLTGENALRVVSFAAPAVCIVGKSRVVHIAAAILYAAGFFTFQAVYRSCIGQC